MGPTFGHMDEDQHESQQEGALVPSEVLDEARDVIAQLVEEVQSLRTELEEHRSRERIAKTDQTANGCQSRLSHSTQALNDTDDEVRTIDVLRKSLLQKSKMISTMRKQIDDANHSQEEAMKKLAVATQELEKVRKRESTLAREAESSRKEAEQCRLQAQAARQAYDELTVYVTGVLQRLRHSDDDTRKRSVIQLDALWQE